MNITKQLAHHVAEAAARPLTPAVQTMALQSLLNVLATSIGASGDEAVRSATEYGQRFGGPGTVPVPGTSVRLDPMRAALAVGLAAHLDDFDDTHLATVIHPGAAALAAAWATAIPHHADGGRLVTAFALGCEVQLRVGLAMTPWHYDGGWHITGTCAALGGAVAATLLDSPQVDPERLERALALAASMSVGNREAFGSMVKPFHPGKGAENGLLAATVASGAGLAFPEDALGRPGGFFDVLSSHHEPDRLNSGFGERWELLDNTFKPYPCGIVCHPAIDAAIELAASLRGRLDDVVDIAIRCHPLVAELTGNPNPATGLQARFSTIHGVAAGLCDGHVALPQYSDARVTAADVARLRSLTRLVVEADRSRDSARVEVQLADGQTLREEVAHARGSLQRPLTQTELEDKARDLIEARMPNAAAGVIDAVMTLPVAPDVDSLVRAACCRPSPTPLEDRQEVIA